MEVKPGYKQTEVGVIPAEWEVAKLSGICSMKSGEGITSANIDQFSRYPCYGGNGLRGFTSRFTHNGCYALIGRQGALCGNVLGVEGMFFASEHAVVVTALARTDIRWLTVVLGDMRLNQYSESSAQPGLSVSKILNLPLALPPLPEQRAIAGALGDVDALLGALERLIAKKRDLKHAAMQQLLTGQTRLPGFTSEWKPKKVGELLNYERPDKYIVKSTDYQESAMTPVLTANKSFVLGYTSEDFGIYNNLPAIIFDDFTTDSKYVDFPFKVKSSAIKILKSRSASTSLKFVYERMRLIQFPLGEHKRYYISEFQHIEFPTPEPDEQTVIAEVLSDMDAEIAALEQRLAKTRALKQGMMQELLTGRVRLI